MFKKLTNKMSGLFLAMASFVLAGCGGGGGGGGSLGNLFSGVDTISALDIGNNIVPLTTFEEASLATIHNPEPATMLLMGGGVAAMTYFKNRKKSAK